MSAQRGRGAGARWAQPRAAAEPGACARAVPSPGSACARCWDTFWGFLRGQGSLLLAESLLCCRQLCCLSPRELRQRSCCQSGLTGSVVLASPSQSREGIFLLFFFFYWKNWSLFLRFPDSLGKWILTSMWCKSSPSMPAPWLQIPLSYLSLRYVCWGCRYSMWSVTVPLIEVILRYKPVKFNLRIL